MGMGIAGGLFDTAKEKFLNHKAIKFLQNRDGGNIAFKKVMGVVNRPGQSTDKAVARLASHVGGMGGLGMAMNGSSAASLWGKHAVKGMAISGGVGAGYGFVTNDDDRMRGAFRGAAMGVGGSLAGRGAMSAYAHYGGARKVGNSVRYNRMMGSMANGSYRNNMGNAAKKMMSHVGVGKKVGVDPYDDVMNPMGF